MPPTPKNNNMTTTTMPCSICCEDNKPNLIALTKCSHVSCGDCLVQWIERVESTGQMSLPGCPFCRLPLTEEETHAILGRPFSPATANGGGGGNGNGTSTTEEMDDLTRQLLQSLNVRPCPRCGAWIEKLQGGCDMMECLCGYRFCYGCGAAGARCGCTPDTHSFWDNVLDRNAGRTVATEATLDEQTGVVDLAKHIAKRKQKDKEDQIRRQRADRRQRTAYEIRTADPLVYYSAKWLFCGSNSNRNNSKKNNNSNASALRMLHQLLQKPKIQMERQTQQRQSARDLRDVDELVMSARWLFTPSRRGAFELLEQLKRRSTYYTRCRRQTLRQSEQQTMDALTYSAKWLFLPESSAFRMLSQQRQAERTRQERDRKRQRAAAAFQYGGSTTTSAHHHLTGTNMIVLKEGEFPEAMIASGSWLYRKRTREATIGHMKRLFLHQTKAARARFNRRFNSFPGFGGYVGIGIGIGGGGGCDNPACNECCWDHRGANCSASAFGERENAMVLRLMFLKTEEEVMEEKQLIAKYGL